jgi:hypothetical protein
MSEVDRLSNSGLYPALPITDRRSSKDKERGQRSEPPPEPPAPQSGESPEAAGQQRPPKSIIDEYA